LLRRWDHDATRALTELAGIWEQRGEITAKTARYLPYWGIKPDGKPEKLL
jgi:hypothetical protein